MCGIVGFTGRHQAAPILLDGLSKLEYRGYESAGIAVRDGEKDIEIIKAKGRLKVLLEKTNAGESVPGMCGIGHTRWATHGEPSEVNAHPHVSDNGNVAAVHNGIIENYQELKEKLLRRGYSFYSSFTASNTLSKLSTTGRIFSMISFAPTSYIWDFSFSVRLRKLSNSAI